MARKAAASAALEEQAERDFNTDVNEAIARTEDEVFADAMGNEPLSDEADTTLEEMGEGLEGEELDEEQAEGEETEPEAGAEGEETEQEAEGEEGDEGEAQQPQPPTRDQRGRFERQEGEIPPRVLREERGRRREAEGEAEQLRAQLRDMQVRLDNVVLQTRQAPVAPKAEPKPEPDMFADPKGYREWLLDEAERKANERVEARFGAFAQQQQQDHALRLNANLETAAGGVRGFEFRTAYQDFLQAHDPRDPRAVQFVQSVIASSDPAKAILEWWERDSNPAYVDHIREQIREAYAPPQRGSRGDGRQSNGGRQQQQIPRHEFRLPRSLNSAVGGGSQRISDPEMTDSSEASVFSYGTRRG